MGGGGGNSLIRNLIESSTPTVCNITGSGTDYGYMSQPARRTENQEGNSTSSNEEDVNWNKPRTNPIKLRSRSRS